MTETEENQTEKIILASRKSVFKTTLVYFVLTIVIIVLGIIAAIFVSDIMGTIVIVTCATLNTLLMAKAMQSQTMPLRIEINRLANLKESEEE